MIAAPRRRLLTQAQRGIRKAFPEWVPTERSPGEGRGRPREQRRQSAEPMEEWMLQRSL